MRRVMILSTVKSVYETFGNELSRVCGGDVVIDNLLDTYLADDPARHGGVFTSLNKQRLFHDLENLDMTKPDLIVVSCSTLSPYIPALRSFFATPIIAIDDAMCKAALAKGFRIAVLATAESAIGPALDKLRMMGSEQGKKVSLQKLVDPKAIAALKAGDEEEHNRRILDMARQVALGTDAIVLAQASMAGMQDQVKLLTGIPTFSSPVFCQQEVKHFLDSLR